MKDIDIYNRISIINVKNKLGLKEKYAKGDDIYVWIGYNKLDKKDKDMLK